MGLSPAVEMLLGLRAEGGGRICAQEGLQFYIPILPPLSTVILDVPPNPYYALIVYEMGGEAVPDSCLLTFYQHGVTPFDAIFTEGWQRGKHDIFVVVTVSEPGRATVTNRTILNQRFAATIAYLRIASADDLGVCYEHLKLKGTSAEAEVLLRAIAGEPQPPVGGS